MHSQVEAHGDSQQFLTTVYLGYEYDESKLEPPRNWSQAEAFDWVNGISLATLLHEFAVPGTSVISSVVVMEVACLSGFCNRK